MALHGVDLSDNNSAGSSAAAVASRNNSFILAKASEGEHTGDPTHDGIVAAARKAGKAVGHYHFAHPAQDPIKEADHFLASAKAKPGDVLALDLEAAEGTIGQRALYALNWLAHVKAKTGASPMFYTYRSYAAEILAVLSPAHQAQLRSYPLWIADPNAPAGHPNTEGWSTWTVHQYGIIGGVDNNLLNGDLHTWAALAIPHPVVRPPVPAPIPKPIPAPIPKPIPAPAKAYTMVIFGEALDSLTAAAATDAFQPSGTVATGRLDVAKAALAAGDVVIAVGSAANAAIGFTHAKAGQVVVSGKQVAIQGASAGDSYVLLGRYLATGK